MVDRFRRESADTLREQILGHQVIKPNNGLCIPCSDIPLFQDDDYRAWFLEEFFHLEACPTCPYAEWGGWYGNSTLARQRFMWGMIQVRLREFENARRIKAGLASTPLKPCQPMPGDPQPHFWPGYRWSETYGAAG